MIKMVKLTSGSIQCNGCQRSNFSETIGPMIYHAHEVSLGYRNQFMTVRLCDDCMKQLIAECVLALNPPPTYPGIEKCSDCGELREESHFAPESEDEFECRRCGGKFEPYRGRKS